MASKNGQKLPSTERAWGEWATLHNVKNSTIHDVRLSSASTIEEEQYLMLRVLWIVSSPSRLNMRQFDLEEWHTQAKELLRGSKAWLKYFNAFDSKEIPEGSFAMAKKYQQQALQTNDSTLRPSVQFTPPRTRSQMGHMTDKMRELVLRTPTKSTGTLEDSDDEQIPPSSAASSFYTPGPEEISRLMYPQTEDEQIVNIALVDFLNALTVHFPHAKDWSIHRKSFKATFQHASFEARTDGYLEDRTRGSRVRALLEVKPMIRRDKQAAIRMQEAAQMVAWIKTDPDINGFLSRRGRRLHVSQDRHEIYLIFAEYGSDYVRHLDQKFPSEVPPFLKMREFGPWRIDDKAAMEKLAIILLAIALRAHSDSVSS